MTGGDRTAATALLGRRGAASLEHVGGSLLDHLVRVADVLEQWGASGEVVLAGLCHAAYGTDGFGPALLGTDERAALEAVIGQTAEGHVHRYGACDRAATYPQLASPKPSWVDRRTGAVEPFGDEGLEAFLVITAANELDVLGHDAGLRERHGAALHRLLAGVRHRLPAVAWAATDAALGGGAQGSWSRASVTRASSPSPS